MADHVSEELSALLDGELDELQRARVEEHLKACPACAAEREALFSAMRSVSAIAPPLEPSPALRRSVLAAIEAEPQGLVARFRALLSVRFLVPAGVAAAAAVVLGAFFTVRTIHPPRLEDLAVAEKLELYENYDVVAMALPAGVAPEDADVVAHLDELEN